MSSRGAAYGMPAFRVDGLDPVAVRIATQMALEVMRNGKGPAIIEAEIYRFFHHGGGLPGSAFGYRTKEEESGWRARDPLLRVAKEMIDRKWLTSAEDASIRENAKNAMNEAVEKLTEIDAGVRRIIPS